MKKNKEFIFGFGTCMVLGFLMGIILGELADKQITRQFSFVSIMIALILGVGLQIIVHESGHLIAGLISGYKFSSFRIGSLVWISVDGKVKLKKYSISGTVGQCLMIPPENRGYDYSVILYNLGGVIMNVIVSAILVIPAILLHSSEIFVVSFVGIFFAVVNGIPMKPSGVANDGANAMSFKKDELARQAFDSQLRCNALLMRGVRMKDMPKKWFDLPEKYRLTNMHTGTILYMQIIRDMDMCEFEVAKEKIIWVLDNVKGLLGLYKNELKCELMFCYIVSGEYEEAEKLYEYDIKKYVQSTATMISRKRQMYAYYMLVEKDEKKAAKELKAFNSIKKTHPYKGDIDSEKELLGIVGELLER